MRIIIFGATGMIGKGVLLECLHDSAVTFVLALGRNRCEVKHERLRELLHQDFFDYSRVEPDLTGYDACFFCLGVSAAGMNEKAYHRLTYELTICAADTLVKLNPAMIFCYVSGAGADSSERGRTMWARVKGKTENHLLGLPFKAAYMFRPAYVHPLDGITSRTRLYRAFYALLGPLYPLLKRLFPKKVTTTQKIGLAMIRVARGGYLRPILENHDINRLALGNADAD